jgi:cytosine deaminase
MLGPIVLPGRAGVYELELEDGRVRTIRPSTAARGRLALPAFADLHVHADRAFARGPRPPRSLADAVALVAEVKRSCTEELVRDRASQLLGRALSHGSLRVRTHVDVDELVEERTLRGVIAARDDLAGLLDVEIVAFASVFTDPASPDGERRLTSALEAGAELLGAVPAFHPDPTASVERILDLALACGVDADLHLDETVDPSRFQLELVADATLARGLEGRVTASHCCALASVDPATARRTIAKVAAAGITVIALPALNLYLEDRGEATPRARGITLVRELVEAGVPVRFGSDNVGDVFYPYGDADPLEAAWLAALTAHLDDEDVLLAGVCAGRSRIEVGDPADLVLIDADSVRDALARRPAGRTIVRGGEVVSGD